MALKLDSVWISADSSVGSTFAAKPHRHAADHDLGMATSALAGAPAGTLAGALRKPEFFTKSRSDAPFIFFELESLILELFNRSLCAALRTSGSVDQGVSAWCSMGEDEDPERAARRRAKKRTKMSLGLRSASSELRRVEDCLKPRRQCLSGY